MPDNNRRSGRLTAELEVTDRASKPVRVYQNGFLTLQQQFATQHCRHHRDLPCRSNAAFFLSPLAAVGCLSVLGRSDESDPCHAPRGKSERTQLNQRCYAPEGPGDRDGVNLKFFNPSASALPPSDCRCRHTIHRWFVSAKKLATSPAASAQKVYILHKKPSLSGTLCAKPVHSGGGADLLHRVQRNPAGGPQAGRARDHIGWRPLVARPTCLSAVGRVLGARQSEDRGRLCLYRRLRGRVRGGNPGPRLPPVLCAEHLQRRTDVRADSSDPGGGAGDLRHCGTAGKAAPALELRSAKLEA